LTGVYHLALSEMAKTLDESDYHQATDLFNIIAERKRLKVLLICRLI
jgi:UTP:GlnB (protein PII) uridylyltransferase